MAKTVSAEMLVRNYPNSTMAYQITYVCMECGKTGTITDGRRGATVARARTAFKKHAYAMHEEN